MRPIFVPACYRTKKAKLWPDEIYPLYGNTGYYYWWVVILAFLKIHVLYLVGIHFSNFDATATILEALRSDDETDIDDMDRFRRRS